MSNEQKTPNLTDKEFAAAINSEIPVLVDFWAPWCGPCRLLSPIIDELAEEYAGRMHIYKLNVDENALATTEYKVRSIPTLIFFKSGQLIERITGGLDKSALEEKILAYLA